MLLRREFWEVGLLHKLILLVFLSLLVVGEAEEVSRTLMEVGSHKESSPRVLEKQLKRSLRHSFDALFSSKRKVPNASDPLHNR